MSVLFHTLSLSLAVVAAYLWMSIPGLAPYSLQVFALATLVFVVLKRVQKAKLWHIVPKQASLEMAVLSFAFLVLIGSTGNTASLFFPLTYVHLFFLVLACEVPTAIATTIAILLFHYGLTSEISLVEIQTFLSLPLMLLIFLFSKAQYDEAKISKSLLKAEALELEKISQEESNLESFVRNFLEPKLEALEEAAAVATQPSELRTGLSLLRSEIDKQLQKITEFESSEPQKN